MVIYTRSAVGFFTLPAETRLIYNINTAFWDMNIALRLSEIPLQMTLDIVQMVSTGWGGVDQASRHAQVFLRGGSDVAIIL